MHRSFFFSGETRLGLMWTCMTLYNRPQVCFTPELQPEWLLALICIFVGCICITTAIILLASSNWDRDVIPYARWVGFTASKLELTHQFGTQNCSIIFAHFNWYQFNAYFIWMPFQWCYSVWQLSYFRLVFTSMKLVDRPINCQTVIKSVSLTLCSCLHFGLLWYPNYLPGKFVYHISDWLSLKWLTNLKPMKLKTKKRIKQVFQVNFENWPNSKLFQLYAHAHTHIQDSELRHWKNINEFFGQHKYNDQDKLMIDCLSKWKYFQIQWQRKTCKYYVYVVMWA